MTATLSKAHAEHVPPHSIDAEQQVLGSLLLEPRVLPKVVDFLVPRHFYRKAHETIYAAIIELHQAEKPFDGIALGQYLHERKQLDAVGGRQYLTDLVCSIATAWNVEYYGKIVFDKARLRWLITESHKVIEQAYESDTPDEPLSRAQVVITKLLSNDGTSGVFRVKDLIPGMIESVTRRYEAGGELVGITTGYKAVDELTAGFQKGEVTILGARPGMGKTQFVCNLMLNAGRAGHRVCMFSLEMTKEAITQRLAGTLGTIDGQKLRHGDLSQEEWSRLMYASGLIADMPFAIFDASDHVEFPLHIEAKIARLEIEGEKPDLVIIDYLSYLRLSGKRESRTLELEEVVIILHKLAVRMQVPILLLCQLSRDVERRQDKRPVPSDLRDSGGIEQVADNIWFLYRDEYYNPESDDRGTCEVIIAKQRNGPLDTVKLLFQSSVGRFCEGAKIGGGGKYGNGGTHAHWSAGDD